MPAVTPAAVMMLPSTTTRSFTAGGAEQRQQVRTRPSAWLRAGCAAHPAAPQSSAPVHTEKSTRPVLTLRRDGVEEPAMLHEVCWPGPARDHQHVRRMHIRKRHLRREDEPLVIAHRFAVDTDDGERGLRQSREHAERTGEIDLIHALEHEHADAHGSRTQAREAGRIGRHRSPCRRGQRHSHGQVREFRDDSLHGSPARCLRAAGERSAVART